MDIILEYKNDLYNLRLQFATSSYGGRRYLPNAFTEQGVAMLSGILNSDIAIEMQISSQPRKKIGFE